MPRSVRILLLVCLLAQALGAREKSADPSWSMTAASGASIELVFQPQKWKTDTVTYATGTFQRWQFDRATYRDDIGMAAVPGQTVTLGVPLQGAVQIHIVEAVTEEKSCLHLLPIPRVDKDGQERFVPDEAYYSRDEFYPAQVTDLSEPTFFRQQRVVRLAVQPLQYNPSRNTVRIYKKLVLRISMSGQSSGRLAAAGADEGLYRSLLLNYEQARSWRQAVAPALQKTGAELDGGPWFKLIVRGDGKGGREGVYKVDGATLQKANVSIASIDPATLQLFNNGGRELPQSALEARPDSLIENAITVVGGEDGKFDSGDYILFYGRSLEGFAYDGTQKRFAHYQHRYSYDNVYWLTYGQKKGKRMADKATVALNGLTPEARFKDLAFVEDEKTNVLASGSEWFGYGLSNDKKTFSQAFALPGAIAADTATVRVQMAVASAGVHSFSVAVNGNKVGDLVMSRDVDGYSLRSGAYTSPGVLVDGNNTLSINYLNSSDIMLAYVDWIEIEYQRRFLAQSDQLLFHAPRRDGLAAFKAEQFSRDDITVWDVTSFYDVARIASPQLFSKSVTFADQVTASTPRRYLAFTPAAFRSVTEIRSATRTDLRKSRDVDYIIIAYDDFYQQAQQLKSLHENWNPGDRLATEIVKISQVIDEFGWGISDPAAIRNFLASSYTRWGQPGYVLLLGDGHYDYKNILKHGRINPIIPYETADRSVNVTRATDDWFTYFRGDRSGMQMAIGRLPVQSVEEAQSLVNKIIAYATDYEPGEWRKTITLLGDDELVAGGSGDEFEHTAQSETLAEMHIPDLFNVRKIYLVEYPAVRTASVSGVTKPQANEALIDQINQGTLILNFIGHGNDELWTHERVLNAPTDYDRLQNQGRLALWVAATCEFAYWDQPDKQSFAERVVNVAENGAVSMVASSRLAFSYNNAAFNYSLFDELFKTYATDGRITRLGDAVMLAKRYSYNDVNSEKYAVLGDPALRLGAPRYRARIERIEPDSLQALRKIRVTGQVEKDNTLWTGFSGTALLRVMDARKKRTYETKSKIKIDYVMPGNSVFRGAGQIQNGRFDMEFIVPKDISYGGNDGRISLYFWNDQVEGSGHYEDLLVGGTAVNLVDHEGPEIKIGFGEKEFMSGDYTTPNPLLNVAIHDSLSGVNIAGDIGHQITMILDGQSSAVKDMTTFFEYNPGSYTTGAVKYQLTDLAEGLHTIQIKAWDNSNNSSVTETTFMVVSDSILTVRNVLNYPNPMMQHTQFTFELSNDAQVTLAIYSVAGRLIRRFSAMPAQVGFNVFPETWDGTDEDGDQVANGVYLYRLQAVRQEGEAAARAEKFGKVVIAR